MPRSDCGDQTRRYPLRMPPDWDPPVPAWSSTFADSVSEVAMCVIGFQHADDQQTDEFLVALKGLTDGVDIADFAFCEGVGGLRQTVGIFYWTDPRKSADWLEGQAFQAFWAEHTSTEAGYGVFRELFNIPLERSETLFSSPERDDGMSRRRAGVEGPIQRHQYWGGMRDRVPVSGHDPLEAEGTLTVERDGNRVRVRTHENLCIIRSGQDWSSTQGDQRADYLERIEPVLLAGMNFLRDKGGNIGCYSCRYMREMEADGTPAERSFGLAYFRTMAELERWAEHHPTHLAIFNTFLEIAPKYGPDLQLRLWHEVSVLPAGNQFGEYVNCLPGTGLLVDASTN